MYRVVIEIHPSLGSRRLILGKAAASALKLTVDRVRVFAGTSSLIMTVDHCDSASPNSLAMDSGSAARFGLQTGDVVRVLARRRQLRIGPYVGIMTAPTRFRASSNRCYGRDTEYFRELCLAGRRKGLVTYVFSYDAVDLSKGRLVGRVPEPKRNGRWYSREFPLPNVIFNRIPARTHERSPLARQLIEYALRQESMCLFNEGFMDKWSVYKQLSMHPEVRHLVPTTAVFRGLPMLKRWLRKYKSVYLKPTSGSLGEGIIVVQQTSRGVVCRYRNPRKRPVKEHAPHVDAIYGLIEQLVANRRYLIQPDLNLLTVNGMPFDVRLLMQRNATGKWCRTKMFARVARRGEFTSNISRGGSGVPLDRLLEQVIPKKAEHVLDAVREAGAAVARAIESLAGSPVGELGIDIGIDRSLNLWLIEVNSKPHIDVTKPSTSERVHQASVRRPMEFAIYLHIKGRLGDR